MAIEKEKLYEALIEDAVYADNEQERKYIADLARSLDSIPANELNQWLIANSAGIFKSLPEDNPVYQMASKVKDPKSWRTNEPDVEGMFGNKDIVEEYAKGQVPEQRIAGVATENGYLPEQVQKVLQEQAKRQSRIEQMYGTNTLQKIFTPRLYEKRLREGIDVPLIGEGSLDTWKSILLDGLENGLYLYNPFGRVAGVAAKAAGTTGKVGQMLGRGLNYGVNVAGNPLAMEIADDIAYDDPNNDRSDFRWSDVAIGSGVNAGIPLLLKGAAAGLSRSAAATGKRDPWLSKFILNFGDGDLNSVLNEIKANNLKYEELKKVLDKEGRGALDASEFKFVEDWGAHYSPEQNKLIEDIMSSEGKTVAEKRSNYNQRQGYPETQMLEAIGEGLNSIAKKVNPDFDPKKFAQQTKVDRAGKLAEEIENSNYAALNDKSLKSSKQMLGEQMLSDYTLNKAGDMSDPDGVLNSTLVGRGAKAVKEWEDENKEKEAKKNAIKKHKIRSMVLPEVSVNDYDEDTREEIDKIKKSEGKYWKIGSFLPGSYDSFGRVKPQFENSAQRLAFLEWLDENGITEEEYIKRATKGAL